MRRALLSSFAVALGVVMVVACSGGSDPISISDGGTSDPDSSAVQLSDATAANDANASEGGSTATPQAIVSLYGGAAAGCQSVPPVTIGDFGDPNAGKAPRPVKDGESEGDGGAVVIKCRVASHGATTFVFEARVEHAGVALELSSTLSETGKGLTGNLSLKKVGGATWTNAGTCTFDSSASPSMGIADGRYWGLLTCMQSMSSANETCDVFGQIRFENCMET